MRSFSSTSEVSVTLEFSDLAILQSIAKLPIAKKFDDQGFVSS